MKRTDIYRTTLAMMVVAALSGCATTSSDKYYWKDYEQGLYDYYKTPAESAAYLKVLTDIVDQAEKKGSKVPPGIFAEYGYLLLQQNRVDEAVQYFQREKDAWPEAAPFMEKMIEIARGNKPETAAAAEPVPGPVGGTQEAKVDNVKGEQK